MMRLSLLFLLMLAGAGLPDGVLLAQGVPESGVEYPLPLQIEPALSGNYGELRANHFHAGLDFKTQGRTGLPVSCFADGYVHRVGINAYGYGLVVYVRHPQLGLTSVYAHLNSFSDKIWQKVRERQVSEEQNNAALTFEPGEISLKRGEVLAQSGNTGRSGGPHLHFELRDCNDEDDAYFDPLPFFLKKIKDTVAPKAQQIYLYPLGGVVSGSGNRQQAAVVNQDGRNTIGKTFSAWGRIGIGIKAYDHMDGQTNIYGVKHVQLYVDDRLIYDFKEDRFRYSETRYTNSLIDYEAWTQQKSMIMKSFIEPGNQLEMLDHSLGDGTILINEPRAYVFKYVLTDAHGNRSTITFNVKGVEQKLPEPRRRYGKAVEAMRDFTLDSLGCHLHIPAGTLYTDQDLVVQRQIVEGRESDLSPIFAVGNKEVPVHSHYDLWLPVGREALNEVERPEQLYALNLDNGVLTGTFDAKLSQLKLRVREFGRFVLRRDVEAPTVRIVSMTWNKGQIEFSDKGSGLKQFKVWIDGKFVPFDMDNTGKYYGHPRLYGISQGKKHTIRIWAVDYCGNEMTHDATRTF